GVETALVTEIEATLQRRFLVGLRNASEDILAEQSDIGREGPVGFGRRCRRRSGRGRGRRCLSGHRACEQRGTRGCDDQGAKAWLVFHDGIPCEVVEKENKEDISSVRSAFRVPRKEHQLLQ